jgi:DNA (cytosine-5)-methyltransferase 1
LDKIREKQKNYVLEDALYGLRKLKAKKNKNDTKNEDLESGLNVDKTKTNGINSFIKKINFNKKIKFIYNHKARYNNSRDINIFKRLPQGGDSTHSSIQDIMPYKRRSGIFKDKYFKLQSNKVCKTITSHMKFDCNMYIHPYQARGLTPREAARVQGFSDNYFFVGPISKCYMQIGNAVPPPLSEVLCRSLEKIINV